MSKPITKFAGKYKYLAMDYPCKVKWAGITWPSAQHAYLAASVTDVSLHAEISRTETVEAAEALISKSPVRNNWTANAPPALYKILMDKFRQNPQLIEELILTDGDIVFVNAHDRFLGTVRGVGQNVLGEHLMQLRAWFRFLQLILRLDPVGVEDVE